MESPQRFSRRLLGMLSARLPEIGLDELEDPRAAKGRLWPYAVLLRLVVVGLACGIRSFAKLEEFSCELSSSSKKRLGISRRVPDTTMRDLFCLQDPHELRKGLHKLTRKAHRRKAIEPQGLPFGVVALDGKSTAIPACDDDYAQRQSNEKRLIGLVRTVTCALVSASAVPCIDAIPIAAKTNEMGTFESALRSLHHTYRSLNLFRLVSYDAGACSLYNANVVRELKLDYLFALKDSQPTLRIEAERLLASLGASQAAAHTEDVIGGKNSVIRRVYLTKEMAAFEDWEHLRTVVRIESETLDKQGKRIAYENRYYLSSLAQLALSPKQWLVVVRKHWGVENNCHHTLDQAFQEDDHPWMNTNPKAVVSLMILRRIAYTLSTLFRSVTQRSDEQRAIPWDLLMRRISCALITATETTFAGLRIRVLATSV